MEIQPGAELTLLCSRNVKLEMEYLTKKEYESGKAMQDLAFQ